MSGPRKLHLIPPSGDLLTKVLLVRFQSPSSLHSRFERHLPMPNWRDEGTTLGSASRAKIVRNQFLRRRPHMKFILVNGRSPRRESFCSLCYEPIGESYLRELTTRLSFCNGPGDVKSPRVMSRRRAHASVRGRRQGRHTMLSEGTVSLSSRP